MHSEASRQFAKFELEEWLEEVDHPGEALESAGIAAHDLWKLANGLGARPMQGLARYLEGMALSLEAQMQARTRTYGGRRHPRPLSAARQKLFEARSFMDRIGDRSLEKRIDEAIARLLDED